MKCLTPKFRGGHKCNGHRELCTPELCTSETQDVPCGECVECLRAKLAAVTKERQEWIDEVESQQKRADEAEERERKLHGLVAEVRKERDEALKMAESGSMRRRLQVENADLVRRLAAAEKERDEWRNVWNGNQAVAKEKARADAAEKRATDAEADAAQLREALVWCSGASDFAPGGKAREGWLKIKHLLSPEGE